MPYSVRYEAYFYDNTADKRMYRTRFLDRDYDGGQITELDHDGFRLQLDVKGSDDPFLPIWGTFLYIGLISDDNLDLSTFYTEDDRKWQVVVDRAISGDTYEPRPLFTGYLIPFGTTREDYQKGRCKIRMTASCGIGSLKDYPFQKSFYSLNEQIKALLVPIPAMRAIKHCLGWLGYSLPIAVSVNCVEKSMMEGVLRPRAPFSVLNNFQIDPRRFLSDTGIGSCYEVLQHILTALNACIVQDGGEWKIVRLDEYADHAQRNGITPFLVYSEFYFVDNHFGQDRNLLRTINRDADGDPLRGSERSIVASKMRLTANFEYGELRNELLNGNFINGLTSWTLLDRHAPDPSRVTAIGDGSDELPFAVRIKGTTDNYRQRAEMLALSQELSYPARNGNADVFKLSLSFKNYRVGEAKFALVVDVSGKGRYYLQEDGTWADDRSSLFKKNNASYYIFKRNTYADSDGFDKPSGAEGKFEVESSPVPGTGAYKLIVILYRGTNLPFYNEDPTAYIEYRDVVVTRRDLAIRNLTGEKIKGEAPGADRKRPAEDLTLWFGDQSSAKVTRNEEVTYYPRYGGFLRMDGKPTERWLPYQSDALVSKNYKKIQQLCVEGRLAMTGRPGQVYTGDLLLRQGEHIGPSDILFFEELGFYARIVGGYKWDIKKNIVSVRAMEILDVGPIAFKNYWDTPEGSEPMEEDEETGDAVQPTIKGKTLGSITIGKIRDELARDNNELFVGKAFTYNSQLGVPVGETPTSGNIINGLLASGKLKLYKPLGSGG